MSTEETPGRAQADPKRATWNPTTVEELRSLQDPGDPDLVKELVGSFRDDAAALLERLRGHAERGELPGVRDVAHRIKGSALNLGADRLARSASALERSALRGDAAAVGLLVGEVAFECDRFLARSSGR